MDFINKHKKDQRRGVDTEAIKLGSLECTRREFLKIASLATVVTLFPSQAFSAASPVSEKSIALFNIHTGESVRTTFWEKGEYIPEAVEQINFILRDFRSDSVTSMDVRLFDLLYGIQKKLDTDKPFNIVSGYRSPSTNDMLRSSSSGVAKNSLHTKGMAIDINVEGVALADIKKAAASLKGGGVGYYPESGFVHVDVGRVRYW